MHSAQKDNSEQGGHSTRELEIRQEGGGCSSSVHRDNSAHKGYVTSPSFLGEQGISGEEQEFLDLECSAPRQHVQEDVGAPCPCHDDTPQEREDSSLVSDLCSPSSLATRLGLIPTPQREAYISSLLLDTKCSLTFNKQVIEQARCSLIFVVKPSMLPQTPTLHPFHHHLPHISMVNTEMWARMSQLSTSTEHLRKLPIIRRTHLSRLTS